MMQCISTHFRLPANHTDKLVVLHVLANQRNAQISDFKTALILFKFLIDQKDNHE